MDMNKQVDKVAHRDFAQSKALNLVRACAPVDLRHKALPETCDELGLGKRALLNNAAHRGDDLLIVFSKKKSATPLV